MSFNTGLELAEYLIRDVVITKNCVDITDAQVLNDLLVKNYYKTIEITEEYDSDENFYMCGFEIDEVYFTFNLGKTKLAKLLK